jgi:hypothetical protein
VTLVLSLSKHMRCYGRITSPLTTRLITKHTSATLHNPHFTSFPFHDDVHHPNLCIYAALSTCI